MPKKPLVIGLLSLLLAAAAYLIQSPTADDTWAGGVEPSSGVEAVAAPEAAATASWDDADWDIFVSKVRWALATGLDTLSTAGTVAALGRSFVGTAYVPRTLEAAGPEHVVVNFRGLDCVTFVENSLALAYFVELAEAGALLTQRPRAEAEYEALLEDIRYRDGFLDGYGSRLHYFSDWIADAQSKGLVVDMTADLGGVADGEAVDFMTTHTDAYPQLSDGGNLEAVRTAEARLTMTGRRYVPQGRVASVAASIQDGDIIAATSTVKGLDVAHTGLALWVDGTLRLLHAPLVGDSVQISEEPLAQRLLGIPGQDGIMVARPTGDS